MHGSEGAGEAATLPRLPDQIVESKARFIEQALAGEITARTVEDTSDVVLSAAEIKAIASGNPQIVRKVQLEAEVARLERVRSVWLDTRRNLQLERHFSEEEIRRIEGRRALWEHAGALVAAHPYGAFYAEVARTISGEQFEPLENRAEAGAAIRRLLHDYQSAAAFQRRRLRGVAARYRGLELVVQAHAIFAADLSLALPDGTMLDTVTAATDTGIWQSVSRTLGDIPSTVERLGRRVTEVQERITAIDRELARLQHWDGQTAYDVAMSELSAINAAFAAAEEEADAEGGQKAPTAEGAMSPSNADTAQEEPLAESLLALARAERARAGWGEWQAMIPPAPASLGWMAAEVERPGTPCPPCPEPTALEELHAEGVPVLADELGLSHSSSKAGVLFGDAPAQHRTRRTEANRPANGDAEVHQLSLF